MSIEFTSKYGGYLSITNSGWRYYTDVAYNHGWKPMGTVMGDDMAEAFIDHSYKVWGYTFWFKTDKGKLGCTLTPNKRLTIDEIEETKRDPEKYWHMDDDDIFGNYVKPYKCLQVDVSNPKPSLVITAEEAKAKWDGGYYTNDMQTILAEDAENLAKALKSAVKQGEEDSFLEEIICFFSQGEAIIF